MHFSSLKSSALAIFWKPKVKVE